MYYENVRAPLEFVTGLRPEAAIILLHGMGGSGRVFEPIIRHLDLQNLGAVRVVLPNAPNTAGTLGWRRAFTGLV